MTDNKTLGQIAYEAASKSDHDPIPWDDPLNKDLGFHVDWEAAGQAIRRAVIDECIQAIKAQRETFASAEYATGQPHSSFGERFACKSCIEALEGLKGETDV